MVNPRECRLYQTCGNHVKSTNKTGYCPECTLMVKAAAKRVKKDMKKGWEDEEKRKKEENLPSL